jgi:hypothetical protein
MTSIMVYGLILVVSESRKPYTFNSTKFKQELELEDGELNLAKFNLFPWFSDPHRA